ncbi:N(2)-acetyl-L-2,4-diaminobutanoate deacetylase DoeB [Granulosicoccaceae sp. 1_MG-2023]|nr:N(2)-acetyl-L-2,4-diaminobutanoate deacetylase DoeB [Granulosicoccaceae sp. 1_MG-2023]
MTLRDNPIVATIDFEKEGIQHGFLRLPHSRDDSAWGAIMIPVTQMKNGDGPTALITGGNHGDEYEGPVALFNFAGRTDISDIQGRVIVIPAMNYPAFCAATRVSPIDNLNMNRIFPGKPHGSVTQIIADFFTRVLLPKADYVLDIHSGGKTLDFVPFATCHELEDKDLQARCEAAMKALNAPYFIKLMEIDAGGMYDTQAESMGKVFVSTELGGGGTTTPRSVDIAKRSVDNFLIHAGILQADITPSESRPVGLAMGEGQSYVFCQHTGLVEPRVMLGDRVSKGDLIARIHITERTAMPPVHYHAPRDGLIIARHVPSLIKMGDCLNVVAEVMDTE